MGLFRGTYQVLQRPWLKSMELRYSLFQLVGYSFTKQRTYSTQPPITATRPSCPGVIVSGGVHCVVDGDLVNRPLWNFSSIGGTILRTLLKRIFDETET